MGTGRPEDEDMEYPDLGFSGEEEDYHSSMRKKVLFQPINTETTRVSRSVNFSSSPPVVHFSGFRVNEWHEQDIAVVNISSHSQRLSILLPTTEFFEATFKKCGVLAPGMSQKITIKFCPKEYKYYYDCLRINGDSENLLIPIHAYPVVNKVDFPKQISFGNSPLSEPAQRTITLRCSIPVNFAYEIEVIQPHPYFNIQPLKGIIPADGAVDINVLFDPITLGTCTTVVKLHIAQHNYAPFETVINARAVSGIIESRELVGVENTLARQLLATSSKILNNTKMKTMNGTFSGHFPPSTTKGSTTPSTKKRVVTYRDPIASVLQKTFDSTDVGTTLTKALPNTNLLGSKVPDLDESGIKKVIGSKKITQPVTPKGVGSGQVFDAGAEWASTHTRKVAMKSKTKRINSEPDSKNERVLEGLRIPDNLNSVGAVNFVLTQEVGKLKPKDLKIAIEKNRAERKIQADEQQKIREEGGCGKGEIDLRAILADEKLNLDNGDVFKRQLREMAFLADVDDVKKTETEKGFRVSEEFIGANILSEEDIETVRQQRLELSRHRARMEWRNSQKRMRKQHFMPLSDVVRAGAPIVESSIANSLENIPLPTSFDTNKNDIWSKRMNSLRRLIAVVSKYIVQRRVMKRYHGLMDRFKQHGVTDIESAKAFVEADAASVHRPTGEKQSKTEVQQSGARSGDVEQFTRAQLVCSMRNQALEKRQLAEKAANVSYQFNSMMARRVLFPKFVVDEASTRKSIPGTSVDEPMTFDDRTFLPLKKRLDYIDMHYQCEPVPRQPLYFQPTCSAYFPKEDGAPEEKIIRPAADGGVTADDDNDILAESLFSLPNFQLPSPRGMPHDQTDCVEESGVAGEDESRDYSSQPLKLEKEMTSAPDWLADTSVLRPGQFHLDPSTDPDVYRARPEYRMYMAQLDCKEIDLDYKLRPGQELKFEADDSFRTDLLGKPGFASAQAYLLGSYASRIGDELPPPGPTLTNFYLPDQDRHPSGYSCFSRDHTRGLFDPDPDVAPLQSRLAPEDVLTDSESDDDDYYATSPPTLKKVRELYTTRTDSEPKEEEVKEKGKGKEKKTLSTDEEGETKRNDNDEDAYSVLDENKKDHHQVELLRDRKMLDYCMFITKKKQESMNDITEKLKTISDACVCPLQAMEVQVPLHQYEDEMLEILDDQVPEASNTFVEQSSRMSRSVASSPVKNSH